MNIGTEEHDEEHIGLLPALAEVWVECPGFRWGVILTVVVLSVAVGAVLL